MKYRALDEGRGDIRLLGIVQPDNSRQDVVSADPTASSLSSLQLDHHPLKDHRRISNTATQHHGHGDHLSGRFVALSYTWGDKNDLDEIIVDGLNLVVRSNLKKALLALRATSFVQAGCRVWTDAICINQKNIAELNSGIKRMKDIYRQAANVIIWLGDAADGSDEAIDFINDIAVGWAGGSESLRKCVRQAFARQGTTVWASLSNLIMREYWSRVWIIQEVAMGGKTCTILCGEKATTWERLYRVYDSFHLFKATHWDPELASITLQELVSANATVYEAYRDVRLWQWEHCDDFQVVLDGAEQDLATKYRHLLTRCRLAKCLKPVDKVYGILGLLKPAISEQIVPKYDSSIRDVYMTFARAWITVEGENGDLGFLIQCGESGEKSMDPEFSDEDLPSWVPDLRKQTRLQLNNFEPEYNAHGGSKASFEFVRDGSVLSAKGILLDKVDGLSGARLWDDDLENIQDFVDAKHCSNPYVNEHGFREALWRAMVGDRDRHGRAADITHGNVLDAAIFDERCARHRFHALSLATLTNHSSGTFIFGSRETPLSLWAAELFSRTFKTCKPLNMSRSDTIGH